MDRHLISWTIVSIIPVKLLCIFHWLECFQLFLEHWRRQFCWMCSCRVEQCKWQAATLEIISNLPFLLVATSVFSLCGSNCRIHTRHNDGVNLSIKGRETGKSAPVFLQLSRKQIIPKKMSDSKSARACGSSARWALSCQGVSIPGVRCALSRSMPAWPSPHRLTTFNSWPRLTPSWCALCVAFSGWWKAAGRTFHTKAVQIHAHPRWLSDSILWMIIKDTSPLLLWRAFREMIKAIHTGYMLPPRHHFTDLMEKKCEASLEREKLKKCYINMTLTTDAWMSIATEAYLGVTWHFIN